MYSQTIRKKYGIAVKIVLNLVKYLQKTQKIYTMGRFSQNPPDEIFRKPDIYDMGGVP
jgi:hypothetical protein